ncbi:MAG: hypothetical protein MUO76_09080 [Anaerolineaceae bacterium]|nr:hypothetical protein [Anaerolineaceae bacterium]
MSSRVRPCSQSAQVERLGLVPGVVQRHLPLVATNAQVPTPVWAGEVGRRPS